MTDQFPVLSRVGARVVCQPFSFEDLLIMLRSVLHTLGALPESSRYLRYGDLEIDEESWDCRRAGNRIDPRPTEFRLVHALVA
jgi:two-component system OmpR family response regulator